MDLFKRYRLTEIFEAQSALDRLEEHGDVELAIDEVLDAVQDLQDVDLKTLEERLQYLLGPKNDPNRAYWAIDSLGYYEDRLWWRFMKSHPLKIQFVVTVLIIWAAS